MSSDQEQTPSAEPQTTPGEPLRPDPGYPETRGGTRDVETKTASEGSK